MRRPAILSFLPAGAVLAWLAALAWTGLRINTWGPFGAGFRFYGLDAPAWLPWLLVGLGAAALVAALAKRNLALPYLAVAPVALLAGGSKQLASVALPDLLLFAALALCVIELLTVRERFDGVVASSANLAKHEHVPLVSFLARYLGALVVGVALLAASLWALINVLAPLLAGRFSSRLADSVELESAVGITIFVVIVLLCAVAVRLVFDGVQARRARKQAPEPTQDINTLRPISREASP